MSAADSNESNGAPREAAGAALESEEAVGMIGRWLCRRPVDLQGDLTPEAKIQMDLRDAPDRTKFLDQLVLELIPEGVAPGIWMR